MTKADLIAAVYQDVVATKKDAADLVELVFDLMKDVLTEGEDIKISGFGKFSVREKSPRKGRNPQTGDEMTITARRVLTFKPSQKLRDSVNR